jgi:glutathione S-transferase
LREARLDFELIKQRVGPNIPVSESFRAINPKLRVPVLAIDDEIITEVPAIFTAISTLAPAQHLLGSNDLGILRTYEWLNFLSGTLHAQAFGPLFRPQRFAPETATHDALRKQAVSRIRECFTYIDGKIVGNHAVGDSFTVVDAFLLVFWRWAKRVKLSLDLEGAYPKYSALAASVMGRDSTKEAISAEGISTRL